MSNPVIITIALVEFCSGFIRQAPMQWYRTFAKQTDIALNLKGDFIYDHWGMFLCIAGISGGVIAGIISDRLFQSRRGPVAAILYLGVTFFSILLYFICLYGWVLQISQWCCLLVAVPLCNRCYGMLSDTASMDFGGRKCRCRRWDYRWFVYLGTGVMSLTLVLLQKLIRRQASFVDKKWWPISMILIGIIGFGPQHVFGAKPKPKQRNLIEKGT